MLRIINLKEKLIHRTKKMFCKVIVLVLLWTQLGATINYQIKHVELDEIQLVSTGPTNFAIGGPGKFWDKGKAFALNGNVFTITEENCQVVLKDWQSLGEDEKDRISQIKLALENYISEMYRFNLTEDTKLFAINYSFDGQQMSSSFSLKRDGQTVKTFQSDWLSMSKFPTDGSISAGRPGLPSELARVIANKYVYTQVYRNGQVQMKSTNCLSKKDKELFCKLEKTWNKVQDKVKPDMELLRQKFNGGGDVKAETSSSVNTKKHSNNCQEENLQQQLQEQEKELEQMLLEQRTAN